MKPTRSLSAEPVDDFQFEDFAAMLEQSFGASTPRARRGDLVRGVILAIDSQGIIVGLGQKRDGVVLRSELDTLMSREPAPKVGNDITVMIVQPEDREGNLVVSILQAIAGKDWDAAQVLLDSDEVYMGTVVAANRGGLIVPFGELRGFVPASHVSNLPRGLDDDSRVSHLSALVGQEIPLKIIEVNSQRRRLVLSQRNALSEKREAIKDRLLENLRVGEAIKGRVSSLRDFGAFVDIGGADGLIHISELAWRRVQHPGEVLKVGDEVEAYILQLDKEGKRIGLSLKRLEKNPWETIGETYQVGQAVQGVVSRVVSFGAFVELDNGIEALLHVSEMGDPAPADPGEIVLKDQTITAFIISLEPERQRMGLSLKDPLPESLTADALVGTD